MCSAHELFSVNNYNNAILKTVVKLKPEKNSGLNGIRTHDLCDIGAVLYQLRYQAIWELVTF